VLTLKRPLILASGSPRRKEILDTMGLSYSVDISDVDESFSGSPKEMVIELSFRKASAVAKRHTDSFVLAADTLVFGHEVLGKPKTDERAKEMLSKLSGNWHSVYTGLTLIDTKTGIHISRADQTRVHFTEMSTEEIAAYVASGEGNDKAGGYAIQGQGGMFIDKIEGSYSNVVGLPMALLRDMLKEMNDGIK